MVKLSPTASATRKAFIEAFCGVQDFKPVEKITVSELTRRAGYQPCNLL